MDERVAKGEVAVAIVGIVLILAFLAIQLLVFGLFGHVGVVLRELDEWNREEQKGH